MTKEEILERITTKEYGRCTWKNVIDPEKLAEVLADIYNQSNQ